jgi:hypothetical protein
MFGAICSNFVKWDVSASDKSMFGFVNWDGIHFSLIASQRHYAFEQQLAFFPGLPTILAGFSHFCTFFYRFF